MPSNEEVEELERHLAEANIDINFAQSMLDKLSNGGMELDEEQLRQLAATLLGGNPTPNINNIGAVNNDVCNGFSEDVNQTNWNELNRTLSSSGSEMAPQTQGIPNHSLAVSLPSVGNPVYLTSVYNGTHVQEGIGVPGGVNPKSTVTSQTASQQYPHPTIQLSAPSHLINLNAPLTASQSFLQHQNSLPNFTASQGGGQGHIPMTQSRHPQQQVQQVPVNQVYVQQQVHGALPPTLQNIQLPTQLVTMAPGGSLRPQTLTTVGAGQQNIPGLVASQTKMHQVMIPQTISTAGSVQNLPPGVVVSSGKTVISTGQNMQGLLLGPDKIQQRTPTQNHHPSWPANLANVINFQNGFAQLPPGSPGAFNHSNDLAANIKFGANSQRVLSSDIKVDLTQQTYHQVVVSAHSSSPVNVPGTKDSVAPAPQVSFDNQQNRVNFQRRTPQFSATTGSNS